MGLYIIAAAVAVCVDTLAAGIACGFGRMRFCMGGRVAFTLTGAVMVCLASLFGRLLGSFALWKIFGGTLLACTGASVVLQEAGILRDIPLIRLITKPEIGDTDKNRIIDFREGAVLSLAVSTDAAIACAGSSAGGFMLPFVIMVLQPLFITIGIALGARFQLKGGGRFCGVLSGMLLIALGVWNICRK